MQLFVAISCGSDHTLSGTLESFECEDTVLYLGSDT